MLQIQILEDARTIVNQVANPSVSSPLPIAVPFGLRLQSLQFRIMTVELNSSKKVDQSNRATTSANSMPALHFQVILVRQVSSQKSRTRLCLRCRKSHPQETAMASCSQAHAEQAAIRYSLVLLVTSRRYVGPKVVKWNKVDLTPIHQVHRLREALSGIYSKALHPSKTYSARLLRMLRKSPRIRRQKRRAHVTHSSRLVIISSVTLVHSTGLIVAPQARPMVMQQVSWASVGDSLTIEEQDRKHFQ